MAKNSLPSKFSYRSIPESLNQFDSILISYVADGKGYRLVSPKGLITVYPKDNGEPRTASFSKAFNEEELKTSNIRYFFPDGCDTGRIALATPTIPPILKKDDVIEIPTTTQAPETTTEEVLPETTTVIEEPKCVQQQFMQCCDDDKARIVLSPTKTGISKIVIPFDTELLNKCSVEEIIDITSEQDNVELLKKLLKFAQRYKL